MELRERATALANQMEGRCTCAITDGGVDCPWCEVFYDVLQGHPVAPHSRRGAPTRGSQLAVSPPRPAAQ